MTEIGQPLGGMPGRACEDVIQPVRHHAAERHSQGLLPLAHIRAATA